MAFVLQQSSNFIMHQQEPITILAVIDPSFIVEFDTWNNTNYSDIADDHIAILKNGSSDHNINSLLGPVSLGNIEDGLGTL